MTKKSQVQSRPDRLLQYRLTHHPNQEEFLNYAFEAMFRAYLCRSMQKTRVHYCSQQKKRPIPIADDQLLLLAAECEPKNSWFELADLTEHLAKKQRQVILLYYGQGLNEAEIASALQVSRQAVHMLHRRALANLRQLYG